MLPAILSTLIPAERLPAVEKALLQTFQTTALSSISPLAGGLSAAPVFKIIVNDLSYVLKLDDQKASATGAATEVAPPVHNAATPDPAAVDLARVAPPEVTCMQIAVKAGIAPPLHYLNTQDGVSITGFIENKPLRAVYTTPDTLLTNLAQTIRSIHAMPPFPKQGNMKDTVEGLIHQVKASPIFTSHIFENFFDYYDPIHKNYPWQDQDKVSSHNDLNPSNIFSDGTRIWVVDWDAAFLNDRYADLAIAANFFVAGEAQEKIFLKAYFGDSLSPDNYARFFAMRQICRLIYACLMFRLVASSDATDLLTDPDLPSITLRQVGEQLGAGQLSLSSARGQLFYGKALLNAALSDMQSRHSTIL